MSETSCFLVIKQKPGTTLPKISPKDENFQPSAEKPKGDFIASLPLTDVTIQVFCNNKDADGNLKVRQVKQQSGADFTGESILNILDLLVVPLQSGIPSTLKNGDGADITIVESLDIGIQVQKGPSNVNEPQNWQLGNKATNVEDYNPDSGDTLNLIFTFAEGAGSIINVGPTQNLEIIVPNGLECDCLCNNSISGPNFNLPSN